jgi:hypothetical protein
MVPQQDVNKMKFLIDRCEDDMRALAVEAEEDGVEVNEAHQEEIMTQKIKHMDELEAINKPMSLHEACRVGQVDVVADILGADNAPELINLLDGSSQSPLSIAVKNNHLHLVRYMLVACKADPNLVGVGGNTPLHDAAAAGLGNKDMVTLLLNLGADPGAANCYGEVSARGGGAQGGFVHRLQPSGLQRDRSAKKVPVCNRSVTAPPSLPP